MTSYTAFTLNLFSSFEGIVWTERVALSRSLKIKLVKMMIIFSQYDNKCTELN